MKVLVIGPSPERSTGGMAMVIREIRDDESLRQQSEIDIYDSYIDGNRFQTIGYSVWAFFQFMTFTRNFTGICQNEIKGG